MKPHIDSATIKGRRAWRVAGSEGCWGVGTSPSEAWGHYQDCLATPVDFGLVNIYGEMRRALMWSLMPRHRAKR